MKKVFAFLAFFSLTFNSNAQNKFTSQDSIRVFYDTLFTVMKNEYLHKNSVNWTEIEPKIRRNLNQYSDFQSSLKEITPFFDFAKASHCTVFFNDQEFTSTHIQPTENEFSTQWIKKYSTNPAFEVKILDNQFGYILMPSNGTLDNIGDTIHIVAQKMHDQICEIKDKKSLKGWIIDLRHNTGGNCYPMLLALYDFLGDNNIWGVLDIEKKLKSSIKLSKGKYIDNNETISFIKPKGKTLTKSKVAILTNIVTASSGEITAIAFKGRENTIFIGETSYGATTSNDKRELPFGAIMALTTGYDSDRNNVFYEKINPDIIISKQDNFDNLLIDENIKAAIKFITEKK